jgi:hypothetical protein
MSRGMRFLLGGEGAFSRHDSGVQREETLRRFLASGADAFGAPSAWLFLIRLHACRAGLRFTRQRKTSLPFVAVNYAGPTCAPAKLFSHSRRRIDDRRLT